MVFVAFCVQFNLKPCVDCYQASVYDATRKKLLCGREDMLALLAAQLKYRQSQHQLSKPVWVDVSDFLHLLVVPLLRTNAN